MARSTRRPYYYPCVGRATFCRRDGNRRLRRISNQWTRDLLSLVDPEEAPPAPIRSEVDNPWNWRTDGNKRYGGPKVCTRWEVWSMDDESTIRLCRK